MSSYSVRYRKFLLEYEDRFFETEWPKERKKLSFEWIDENKGYSRDPESSRFPCHGDWPDEWVNTYKKCVATSKKMKLDYLKNAEIYRVKEIKIYILNDEVWLSTPDVFDDKISQMEPVFNLEYNYDSALTAAHCFINSEGR